MLAAKAVTGLVNQYIKEYVSADGDTIKYNMKPQTLLVDFDPHRMFVMQEQKSQIYNANIDASGNDHLRDRLEHELRISPIITFNKNKIKQVEASDILTEIGKYSTTRGVLDEAMEIPVDMNLLNLGAIKEVIESQAELGSRQGLSIAAHIGGEGELDIPQEKNDSDSSSEPIDSENVKDAACEVGNDTRKLENKFRTYYSRILFFAFLTKSAVSSLEDILNCIEEDDNPRIATNLSLNKDVLFLFKNYMNIFILRQLDYKIQNLNSLAHDESVEPIQRAAIAIRKFGRISYSEITTPEFITDNIVSLLPDECFITLKNKNARILDIASKMGEFAVAIVKHCHKLNIPISDIKNKVLSIATSSVAYEFTNKVYGYLGLDPSCIATTFHSYDLLAIKKEPFFKQGIDNFEYPNLQTILMQDKRFSNITLDDNKLEDKKVKFNAVVGNPPYQEKAKGTSSSDDPIYHTFMDMAYAISDRVALITPARFLSNAGKTPSRWNKKMLNDPHFSIAYFEKDSSKLFKGVLIPGGVAVTYRDVEQDSGPIGIFTPFAELAKIDKKVQNKIPTSLSSIMYVQSKFNLDALYAEHPELKLCMSGNGKDKRFRQIVLKRFPEIFTIEPSGEDCYRILGKIDQDRSYRFIKKKYVLKEDWIEKYKVFIPFSNGASGTLGDVPARLISRPVIGYPYDGMTQTFIGAGAFETEAEAVNLNKYIHSKFARAMLGILKVTQGNKIETWEKVPLLDFSSSSFINWNSEIPDIDRQLYSFFELNSSEIDFIENHVADLEF